MVITLVLVPILGALGMGIVAMVKYIVNDKTVFKLPSTNGLIWLQTYSKLTGVAFFILAFLLLFLFFKLKKAGEDASVLSMIHVAFERATFIPVLISTVPIILYYILALLQELVDKITDNSFISVMESLEKVGWDSLGNSIDGADNYEGIVVMFLLLTIAILVCLGFLYIIFSFYSHLWLIIALFIPLYLVLYIYPPFQVKLQRYLNFLTTLLITPIIIEITAGYVLSTITVDTMLKDKNLVVPNVFGFLMLLFIIIAVPTIVYKLLSISEAIVPPQIGRAITQQILSHGKHLMDGSYNDEYYHRIGNNTSNQSNYSNSNSSTKKDIAKSKPQISDFNKQNLKENISITQRKIESNNNSNISSEEINNPKPLVEIFDDKNKVIKWQDEISILDKSDKVNASELSKVESYEIGRL